MQNSMVVFTFSVSDWKYDFWENLVQKLNTTSKYPYSELFWSVFSRILTEYGEIRSISLYLVQMGENTDRNNSEYGNFSRSAKLSV